MASTEYYSLDEMIEARDRATQTYGFWRPKHPAHIKLAYIDGMRDFRSIDLSWVKLDPVSLAGADFSRSRMTGTRMTSCEFNGANFAGAVINVAAMQGASFEGANLQRATLRGSNLSSACFRDANLQYARLDHSNLKEATFYNALLTGADLRGANISEAWITEADDLAGVHGLYVAHAPGMSSRGDTLYGGLDYDYGLMIDAGCFSGSVSEFVHRADYIMSSDWRRIHFSRYQAAIQFIETCYKLDVAGGIFAAIQGRAAAKQKKAAE